uniref:Uncharacterized protein n=1 Tax=Clandestinovirus TaxID=2831644 RepID=A0A8F8KR22_9VIRU|nr:hypothetical protein KOM_12_335 [Clandestinovirus]
MAELLIPIVKKTLIPGRESRNPNISVAKKIRADRVVAGRTATEDFVFDFSVVAPMTDKGQTWVYNEDGEVAALDVGTDGQILRADSAAATGVAWSDDPTTLLTDAGDLLTFDGDSGAATVLIHPGPSNQGYVLSSADPTVGTGLTWKVPTLLSQATSTVTSSSAPLLGGSDSFTVSWQRISTNWVRLEFSEISFTAQASANLRFDLPAGFPLPAVENRYLVSTKNGATIADGQLYLNPAAAAGQMVTIAPNRDFSGFSPSFTSAASCKVYSFSIEYRSA